jgi:hypothetical protein
MMYLRLEFSREKLFERQIALSGVAHRIRQNVANVVCVYVDRHANAAATMLVFLTRPVVPTLMAVTNASRVFRMLETRVRNIRLSGVVGIRTATVSQEMRHIVDHTGRLCKMEENVITVNSSQAMRSLSGVQGFDTNSLLSNDIIAVFHEYGIEAARLCIMRQLTAVLCADGGYLHPSHIVLLADTMTRLGEVVSTARHGAKKSSRNTPIQMCTFEIPMEHLFTAAQSGTIDMLHGPSESIMLGQLMRGGTGLCDVIMDIRQVEACAKQVGITNEIRTLVQDAHLDGEFVISDIPDQGLPPEDIVQEVLNQPIPTSSVDAAPSPKGMYNFSETEVWSPRWLGNELHQEHGILTPKWTYLDQDEMNMSWDTCEEFKNHDPPVLQESEPKRQRCERKIDPYQEIDAQDMGAEFLGLGQIVEND